MPNVLVVNDDPDTLLTYERLLRLAGHNVRGARTGHAALRMTVEFAADVALVDLKLRDVSGITVIQQLRKRSSQIACVVVSELATRDDAVQALRAGAVDWLDKPVWAEDLLDAVTRACAAHTDQISPLGPLPVVPHALQRLAETAILFLSMPEDVQSMKEYGHAVGVSEGGLRNWCYTARIPGRQFLRFARALRAVYRRERSPDLKPENLLQIVDRRTLSRFLLDSGGSADELPLHVEDFLQRERFVKEPDLLATVRAALRKHHLPRQLGSKSR